MAAAQQLIAQVRSEESRATSDKAGAHVFDPFSVSWP
jgi:hypothetical protein